MDPATLDPEAQRLFLEELARLMQVHPSVFAVRPLSEVLKTNPHRGQEVEDEPSAQEAESAPADK